MSGPLRPVPDPDSARYWESLGDHALELQRCADCGAWRWPPRAICGVCGSFAQTWERCSEAGTVESWVVNHHRFSRAFETPYTVVLGRLDVQPDVCLPAIWAEPSVPSTGQAIRLDYRDGSDADGPLTVPIWRAG